MGTSKRERQKELHRAKREAARTTERRATITRRVIGGVVALLAVVGFAIAVNVIQDDDDTEVATDLDPRTDIDDPTEPTDTDDTIDPTEPTDTTEPADPNESPEAAEFQYGTTPCPGADAEVKLDFDDSFEQCLDPAKSYTATFQTNLGEVVVELDTERTPGTANNFVALSRHGYYDDTLVFRVDSNIDIAQGGSPHTNDNADPGPGYTIPDEGGEFSPDGTSGPFTYEPGQLVMARTSQPNSAGGQYFFTLGPKASDLDDQGTYVVFGTVTEGLDVLSEMLGLEDAEAPGVPSRLIAVQSLTITES